MHIFVSSVLIELFSDSKANDFPSEADSIDGRSSGKTSFSFLIFRSISKIHLAEVFCSKQTNH